MRTARRLRLPSSPPPPVLPCSVLRPPHITAAIITALGKPRCSHRVPHPPKRTATPQAPMFQHQRAIPTSHPQNTVLYTTTAPHHGVGKPRWSHTHTLSSHPALATMPSLSTLRCGEAPLVPHPHALVPPCAGHHALPQHAEVDAHRELRVVVPRPYGHAVRRLRRRCVPQLDRHVVRAGQQQALRVGGEENPAHGVAGVDWGGWEGSLR